VAIEDRGPLEPGLGEVTIENAVSLISTGTELTLLEAKTPPDSVWTRLTSFPCTPGYCSVGRVVAVGEGVDGGWLGARVSSRAWAGHARLMRAKEGELRRIHREIPDEQAAFCSIAEIVMNGVRRAAPQIGEAAVVFGLGLLGQLAARFLRLAGCRPVVAADVEESRLRVLPDDPALLRLNPRREDPVAFVRRHSRGRLADLAFEVTGAESLIPDEFAVLREQGRFVVLSSPRGKTAFDFHDLCNRTSVTIIGAHVFSTPERETPATPWTARRNAELFVDLVADGELDMRPLISHRESGLHAPALYRQLIADRGQAMGVLLDWRG
jgi:threonine dehydrogenase-like Zn-dependent dehydrogenase